MERKFQERRRVRRRRTPIRSFFEILNAVGVRQQRDADIVSALHVSAASRITEREPSVRRRSMPGQALGRHKLRRYRRLPV